MIHIGTVHLNGREYSLELNRTGQSAKDSEADVAKRKNQTAARPEVVLLNPNKRPSAAHTALRPNRNVRSIEELRRMAVLARREPAHARPEQTKWKRDQERLVKLISRFLSWCFPLREFHSPLQRILYLSVEGPKSKYRRRVSLP